MTIFMVKRIIISYFLILAFLLTGSGIQAQDHFSKAIQDLEKMNPDSITIFKELAGIPKEPLKLFCNTLPNKKKKPFVERRNSLVNGYPKYPRIFQFAAVYKEYWFFTYVVNYGRYSEGITAVMLVINEKEMDFIMFLGSNFQPKELSEIPDFIDKHKQDLKKIGSKKYADKDISY